MMRRRLTSPSGDMQMTVTTTSGDDDVDGILTLATDVGDDGGVTLVLMTAVTEKAVVK